MKDVSGILPEAEADTEAETGVEADWPVALAEAVAAADFCKLRPGVASC